MRQRLTKTDKEKNGHLDRQRNRQREDICNGEIEMHEIVKTN